MKFERTHKSLTFTLAAVSSVPVLISGEVGFFFVALFLLLFVAGWFLEPPLTRNASYRRLANIAMLTVLGVQIIRFLMGMPMAGLGVEFATALLGIKLCSRGQASDYQQITILSFLHVIAGTIVMDDLLYGLTFIVFVLLSPPVLALGHLRSEIEGRFANDKSPEASQMLAKLLASKRIVSPGFVISAGFLSLPVLLMTALLFISFPRIGLGLLGRLPRAEHLAGFTDEVSLGDIDISRLEDTVMFRLEPLSPMENPPVRLSLKMRGAVLDVFDDGVWKRSGESRWLPMKRRGSMQWLGAERHADPKRGFQVLLDSYEPPLLFLPQGTGMIETQPLGTRGRYKARKLGANIFGMVKYNDETKTGIRYKVYLTNEPPWGIAPDADHDFLQLPAGSERLRALAKEYAGQGPPMNKIRGLIHGLREDYRYSTQLSTDPNNALAKTPLDRFLFTRKTGTCEHFATAMTLMSRAVGIPARVVTGFSSATWNPLGQYYTVQKRSAHAWTEVYIDGRWVTVDATPPAPEGGLFSGPSQLSMILDAIEMRWRKHVIGYDASSQMELALGMRSLWKSRIRGQLNNITVPRWIWVVPVLIAGLFALWQWRRRLRLPGGSGAPRGVARHKDEILSVRMYRQLESRLQKLGLGRPSNVTPLVHLATIKERHPELLGVSHEVTERYLEIRFGQKSFARGEYERLRGLIKKLGAGDNRVVSPSE